MDLARQAITVITEHLQIEEEWSVKGPNAVDWWAGNLLQAIWSDEPFEDDGIEIVRLHCRTDVISGFSGNIAQTEFLGLLLSKCSLSGFVRPAEDLSRLQLASSMYVNPSTIDWVPRFFALVCALQLLQARWFEKLFQELSEGDPNLALFPDLSQHPLSGKRLSESESIESAAEFFGSEVDEASSFAGSDLAELVGVASELPFARVNGSDQLLVCELPFIDDTSLLVFDPNEPHSIVGNGLRASLAIPVVVKDPVMDALRHNEHELSGETMAHFLGTWCLSERGRFEFVSYFPNSMYSDNLLWNIFGSMVTRARYVAEDLYRVSNPGSNPAASKKAGFLKRIFGKHRNL